jgi:putative FmdB family regulatory protein
MPLYEYQCEDCGPFEAFRAIAQASAPLACPSCSSPASRSWSAPRVRGMSSNNLKAAERNEKSRHAPHVCKSGGCGCSGRKRRAPQEPAGNVLTRSRPQRYTGARPWVIEHG